MLFVLEQDQQKKTFFLDVSNASKDGSPRLLKDIKFVQTQKVSSVIFVGESPNQDLQTLFRTNLFYPGDGTIELSSFFVDMTEETVSTTFILSGDKFVPLVTLKSSVNIRDATDQTFVGAILENKRYKIQVQTVTYTQEGEYDYFNATTKQVSTTVETVEGELP